MNQIQLRLLGQPEVRVGERRVTFATRKAQALLIYLAVQGETVARETLTSLFWPESAAGQGRATLRSTLAFLRDALGEAADQLSASRDALYLEQGASLDVQQLAAAAQATRQLPLPAVSAAADLRLLVTQLQAAADLYRGDFLEGFSLNDAPDFDDWASLQREVAHRHAAVVFDWLSQLQMDGGEPAEAITTLQRWLAHDPLNEAGYRRLIQLHFANDDFPAALRAYEACRAVLERELNAEPAPETQVLVSRLRARHAVPREVSERERVTNRTASGLGLTPLFAEVPLVGRSQEHAALVQAFRLARRGQFQIVAVVGEPGIGKTRLVREFLAWAVGEGAEVLAGRAYESSAALPYQPMVAALRARLRLEPDPSRLLSRTWIAELSRLLPELADTVPDLPPPLGLDDAEARARLYEAVARLGTGLAAVAPLVLFIDDGQWADDGSLELLGYLVQHFAQPGAQAAGLLVLALRTEDLATMPALADWLSALGQAAPLTRLSLGALSLEDIGRLVRAVGIAEPAAPSPTGDIEALAGRLFEETEGQPFFALQVLRSLAERRVLVQDPAGAWHVDPAAEGEPARQPAALGLPDAVRDLVRARLSRLSPNGLAACAAGAVLGDGLDLRILGQVADLDEAASLTAIEEMVGRGLLRELPGQRGQAEKFYFTHDKLRETAYADLSAARRRGLHRRALQALETVGAPPAELAHHALAAAEARAAFTYSVAAGDAASDVFAGRDALRYYTQAEALLADTRRPSDQASLQVSDAERQHLLLQMGAAYEFVNDWPAAKGQYERLLTQARARGWLSAEGLALNRLALVAAKSRFDIAAAAGLLVEAQQVARRSEDQGVSVETEMNLAQMGLYRWDANMMQLHGVQARTLAAALKQPALEARALNMLAYAGVVSGAWETIEELARESWELYVALGNRVLGTDSEALMGASQTQNGRAREGLGHCQAAYALCLELENEWGQANSAFHLANTLLELGRLGKALAVAQQGVAAARTAGHPPLLVFNLAVCGSICRTLFDLATAHALHQEAQAVAQALKHPYLMEWAASELCADGVFTGDWAGALGYAQQALAVRAMDPSLKSYAGLTRWCQTEALARSGPAGAQQAAEDLQHLDRQTRPAHYCRYRIGYLRAAAALEFAAGPDPVAEHQQRGLQWLKEAAELAEQLDLPVELWQIEARLREHFETSGQLEPARQASDRAAKIVQRLADQIADGQLRANFLMASMPGH